MQNASCEWSNRTFGTCLRGGACYAFGGASQCIKPVDRPRRSMAAQGGWLRSNGWLSLLGLEAAGQARITQFVQQYGSCGGSAMRLGRGQSRAANRKAPRKGTRGCRPLAYSRAGKNSSGKSRGERRPERFGRPEGGAAIEQSPPPLSNRRSFRGCRSAPNFRRRRGTRRSGKRRSGRVRLV